MSTWEELDDTLFGEETKKEEKVNLCLMVDTASEESDSELDEEVNITTLKLFN